MTSLAESAAVQVALLRAECRERGTDLSKTPDLALDRVLHATGGDIDLAATAVTMKPRPGWVANMIGR